MVKSLVKLGNSYALVIDKNILKELGLGSGGLVSVSNDNRQIIIKKASKADIRDKIKALNERHKKTLQYLANEE